MLSGHGNRGLIKEIGLFYNLKNSRGILIINKYIWHVNYFINLLHSYSYLK